MCYYPVSILYIHRNDISYLFTCQTTHVFSHFGNYLHTGTRSVL
jgi:hypothetical protein